MPHRYTFLRSLPPLRQVEGFKSDPVGAQERLLRKLLTRARDTEWGRRLGFAEILQAKDIIAAYQARVPLQGYEEVRADIERVRRGERDVMWPGKHRHFAVSSGTASAGKIIPLSQDMLNANKRFSVGTGLNYLRKSGDASFIFGKHLTLPGRIEESAEYPGTLVGEVSGLQAENAPKFFSSILQAIPNEVSFLPNWEQKLEAIADRSMEMDIRLVVMAPTWGLTFFQTLIERYNRRHNASAASVGEIWPNLRVFISGGVALKSYHTLLEEAIALPEMQFLETYGASEGFFSFQDQLDDPSMLLHLDNGVFFEFVPMDRLGDDDMHSTLLNHIAVVHFHRGSYDEATALHQRALALQERSLGPDNFEAGTSLTGLANVLHARGSSDEAIPLFEQALALREQALGPEHPDIADLRRKQPDQARRPPGIPLRGCPRRTGAPGPFPARGGRVPDPGCCRTAALRPACERDAAARGAVRGEERPDEVGG